MEPLPHAPVWKVRLAHQFQANPMSPYGCMGEKVFVFSSNMG